MNLNLTFLDEGLITLSNKPGRVEKIEAKLQPALHGESLSRQTRQELHGLRNFCSGFYGGRSLRQANAMIFEVETCHRNPFLDCAYWARNLIHLLRTMKPRTIKLDETQKPLLVFIDGSLEEEVGGMGAVVFDAASFTCRIFEGIVPRRLLDHWYGVVGKQVISQIELFVLALIRFICKEEFQGRRVIYFIDNEAARFGLIKGRSDSNVMNALITLYLCAEAEFPSYSWIERVASASNPADKPSRFMSAGCAKEFGANAIEKLIISDELIDLLTKEATELYWSVQGVGAAKLPASVGQRSSSSLPSRAVKPKG